MGAANEELMVGDQLSAYACVRAGLLLGKERTPGERLTLAEFGQIPLAVREALLSQGQLRLDDAALVSGSFGEVRQQLVIQTAQIAQLNARIDKLNDELSSMRDSMNRGTAQAARYSPTKE